MTTNIACGDLILHYKAVHRRLWNLPAAAPKPTRVVFREVRPFVSDAERAAKHAAEIRAAALAEAERIQHHAIAVAALTSRTAGRQIILDACRRRGVSFWLVASETRVQKVVRCRQEMAYRLAAETNWSLPKIGQEMGGFDHTTILHGIRTHAKRNGLPIPREVGSC